MLTACFVCYDIFIYKSKLIWDGMLFNHWLHLFLVISLKKQIYSYKKIQNKVLIQFFTALAEMIFVRDIPRMVQIFK